MEGYNALAELHRTGLEAASIYVYGLVGDAFALAGRRDEARRYRQMSTPSRHFGPDLRLAAFLAFRSRAARDSASRCRKS